MQKYTFNHEVDSTLECVEGFNHKETVLKMMNRDIYATVDELNSRAPEDKDKRILDDDERMLICFNLAHSDLLWAYTIDNNFDTASKCIEAIYNDERFSDFVLVRLSTIDMALKLGLG